MTSSKYPGWQIEKQISSEGRISYLMTRDGSYAIRISEIDGAWTGSLLMKSNVIGTFFAPTKPFRGQVSDCIAEADRRDASAARTSAWLAANGTKPWGAEARKLRGEMSRQPGTYGYARPAFRRAM